jgi:hypothetical protein
MNYVYHKKTFAGFEIGCLEHYQDLLKDSRLEYGIWLWQRYLRFNFQRPKKEV